MSIHRRSFLMGGGALALGQLLAACQAPQMVFRIRILRNSIPAQMVSKFQKQLRSSASAPVQKIEISPEPKLAALFTLLQSLKQQADARPETSRQGLGLFGRNRKKTIAPTLMTLGDYWLGKAIEQKLIQPLETTGWQAWKNIPDPWQALVRRDDLGQPDAQGKIWGAPYSWGTTVIAYRPDQFKAMGLAPPRDWSDLWRADLKGRISLPDNAREVIGLTLKKLGQSYNTSNLSDVSDLNAQLQTLHQQVKFYSSNNYLQPLVLGDTLVAVGWSTDFMPLIQQDQAAHSEDQRTIAAIVPQSGTALWANLWVRPAEQESTDQRMEPFIDQWINFCWEPTIATQLSLLTKATSPIVVTTPRETLPPSLKADPILFPPDSVLDNSEFLTPLSKPALEEYNQLWNNMRQA